MQSKPELTLEEIKRNSDRYEKIRKMTMEQFSGLWMRALTRKESFDEIIDAWIDDPPKNAHNRI